MVPKIRIGSREYHNVRLRRRDQRYQLVANWQWIQNPFRDSIEMKGYKLLMAVISNSNLSSVNNHIIRDNDSGEQIYYVSGLRSTLGAFLADGKYASADTNGYAKQRLLRKSRTHKLVLAHPLGPLDGIDVEAAEWTLTLLKGLSDHRYRMHFERVALMNARSRRTQVRSRTE